MTSTESAAILATQFGLRHVAIVDDETDAAEMNGILLEQVGVRPVYLREGKLKSVQAAVEEICRVSEAAICDHRLQPRGLASFYGAELAAALMQRHFPAIVVSQFVKPDIDVSLRRWRASLPSIVSRESVDGETFVTSIVKCVKELRGEVDPARRPHRTLFYVADLDKESGEKVADVIIPAWHAAEAVRFPLSLMPKPMARRVRIGDHFAAEINAGAESSEDLFFRNFERLEGPDDRDRLG